MNKKTEFNELIKKSVLSDADKNMWFSFIEVVADEQIILLLDFLVDNPSENLEIINNNLKRKIKLIGNSHSENAQKIIDEEAKIIDEKLSKE